LSRPALALFVLGLALAARPALATLPPDPLVHPLFEEILALETARDDGARLAELARHETPLVRARALRALGRAQSAANSPIFASALSDPDAGVRDEAALAMGFLWAEGDEGALIAAFPKETDATVRDRIVEAVGRVATAEVGVPFLESVVSGDDPALATRAALALGVAGYRKVDVSSATSALAAACRSPHVDVRRAAAYAFYRGRPEASVSYLRPLLNDADPLVRVNAIKGLAASDRPNLGPIVSERIRDDDWRVRLEAIRAMVPLKAGIFLSLVSLGFEDPAPIVRIAAIETVGQLQVGTGLDLVEPILRESDDWRYRAAALIAKTRITGDGALPTLVQSKASSDWRIRRAVAEALAILNSDQARNTLSEMTADENPAVLAAVAASLANYPQVLALDDLRTLLKNADPVVLTNAASALGQRADREAVTPLATAWARLKSPTDVDPMVEILGALGNIVLPVDTTVVLGPLGDAGRATAMATLEAGLRDGDERVARAAAAQLLRIQGRDRSAEIAATPRPFPLYLDRIQSPGATGARLVTRHGDIVIEFLPGAAPNTVANFLELAGRGYFDGLNFHRVVPGFVTQDGCPRGDGWGGPGYDIRCEYNDLRYDTGMVGMALSGKDTGGSQYFITHAPQPHLDGRYTIFGRVTSGISLLEKLLVGDTIEAVELIP
jgi:cyclophilin family peptidyl-prolyl cis-trans isomerase/HEAT repeat protein